MKNLTQLRGTTWMLLRWCGRIAICGIVALHARSYWVSDGVEFSVGGRGGAVVTSYWGRLALLWMSTPPQDSYFSFSSCSVAKNEATTFAILPYLKGPLMLIGRNERIDVFVAYWISFWLLEAVVAVILVATHFVGRRRQRGFEIGCDPRKILARNGSGCGSHDRSSGEDNG